jgi:hypothetical protein
MLFDTLVQVKLHDRVTLRLQLSRAHFACTVANQLLLVLGVELHRRLVSLELLINNLV